VIPGAVIHRLAAIGKPQCGGFSKYYLYSSVTITRSASPIFLSVLDAPRVLSCPWAGLVLYAYLGGGEGTGGSELAEGVGAGEGQPGSSAMARRSVEVVQPFEFRVSPGGEARSYAWRRRVASGGATRSSGRGRYDRPPPRKTRYGGFLNTYF
jgi:hypothetical protein